MNQATYIASLKLNPGKNGAGLIQKLEAMTEQEFQAWYQKAREATVNRMVQDLVGKGLKFTGKK